MKHTKAFPLLLFFATAAHAFQLEPEKITVELKDRDSGKGIPGAHFRLQEHHWVGKVPLPIPYASSSPMKSCLRGAAGQGGESGAVDLVMPGVEVSALDRILEEAREISLTAYAPGYCVAEVSEAGGKRLAMIEARRDPATPRARIHYLKRAHALSGLTTCDGRPQAGDVHALRRAILDEITALERSVEPHVPGRGFAIVGPGIPASAIDWSAGNGACAPGDRGCSVIHAERSYPAGVTPPPHRPLRIVCRDPSRCDLDRLDSLGRTALYQYIHAAIDEPVALLLAAGADPNIERAAIGTTGTDALLASSLTEPPGRIDAALRTVRALAADGRATISADTARNLARPLGTRPSPLDAETLGKVLEIRRTAAAFPVREAAGLACADRFSKPAIGEQ